MIAEFGHFALILALALALVQSTLPLIGAQMRWNAWMGLAEPAALAQLGAVAVSFGALTYSFVVSDFSLVVVADNSHSLKPMLYKVAGVWGNHEGSLLLWALILALFGAACAVFGGNLPATLKARVLSVQGMISVAFLLLLSLTSNPFARLDAPPMDGADLNPLLQDSGLAFHPPFLYLGYVGLSMAFSFAIAALIEGRVDAAWGRWVRPWTLAAWVFLTIGIALGSWWAYYELGWGGFWFWDPVENASFMPWLISAALLHSAIVVEKRESLKSWTILLAIIAFGFSLIGTFLVRSGIITSVHAFANDPTRGTAILIIIGVFTGGGLVLYAARAAVLEAKGAFSLASRETALVLNNILLAAAAFTVFVGTLWPLVAELLWGRVLSVGAPFFNATFTPFFVLLAIALPIGSILPWKRGKLGKAMYQLRYALIFALALALLGFAVASGQSAVGPIGLGLGGWLIGGALVDLRARAGQSASLSRLMRLPRADWGRGIAHAGLGVTMIGVALITAWQSEDIRVAHPGDTWEVGGYHLTFHGVNEGRGPNYLTSMAVIEVQKNGASLGHLYPEKRIYPVAAMPTTEAAIRTRPLGDLYLALGDAQGGGGWAVRTYIKPFAAWIWLGSALMALGGTVSLFDRRFRIGAGAGRAAPARKPREVPAE